MKISISPSGKYKLTILETEPYNSVGQVFLGDELIDTINRNYPSFPYCWVEGHKNGHDYLICGEDYQGQTVIELDGGKRKDALSPHADQGYGLCWELNS